MGSGSGIGFQTRNSYLNSKNSSLKTEIVFYSKLEKKLEYLIIKVNNNNHLQLKVWSVQQLIILERHLFRLVYITT